MMEMIWDKKYEGKNTSGGGHRAEQSREKQIKVGLSRHEAFE